MNTMKKNSGNAVKKAAILFTAAIMLLAALPVFASEELDGRTVAEKGRRGTVSGILEFRDGEWYLLSGDVTYDLHLGLYGHDGKTTSAMKNGENATVDGFILEKSIAPISLISDGKTYRFRNENGAPLWSGQGNRRNAAAIKG